MVAGFARPWCVSALALIAMPAAAQQAIPGFDNAIASRQQRIGENHYKLIGGVELKRGDTEIYAEEAEAWTDQNRVIASGNVVFSQGANRIAADRAEYNTKTRLGTFSHATGIASVGGGGPPASRSATRTVGSSDNRAATTAPAEPPPTTTKSNESIIP